MVSGHRVWSEADDALLRSLWESGLPATQIGQRLGLSKSAIIGRARRLGVAARKSPIIRGGAAVVAAAQRSVTRAKPVDAARVQAAAACVPAVVTVPMGADGCRWPLGDPKERAFRFCEAPRPLARPYCEAHHAIAFVRRI